MAKIQRGIKEISQSDKKEVKKSFIDGCLKEIRRLLHNSSELKAAFRAAGYDGNIVTKLVYQGSYKDGTGDRFYKKIAKPDVDVITVLDLFEVTNDYFDNSLFNSNLKPIQALDKDYSKKILELGKLKELIFKILYSGFKGTNYKVIDGTLSIKVQNKQNSNDYSVEITAGVPFNLEVEKKTFEQFVRPSTVEKMIKKKLVIKTKDDMYILKGYALNKKTNYNDYILEPNFSNFNSFFISDKNGKTHGSFIRYVTTFRKIINAHNFFPKNKKIGLKSTQLLSVLHSVPDRLFIGKINKKTLLEVLKKAGEIIKSEEVFINRDEINKIFRLNRDIKFNNLREWLDILEKAIILAND